MFKIVALKHIKLLSTLKIKTDWCLDPDLCFSVVVVVE